MGEKSGIDPCWPCIVPDGTRGQWKVSSYTITERDSRLTAIRQFYNPDRDEFIPPGNYKKLTFNSEIVMTDTPMEYRTCKEFIKKARGNVLINGLGLGLVIRCILAKPIVKSVTVVELNQEVIDLVWPLFKNDSRCAVVCEDAIAYEPREKYDVVWHDIWNTICNDNLPEYEKLFNKYRGVSKWQGAWGFHEITER